MANNSSYRKDIILAVLTMVVAVPGSLLVRKLGLSNLGGQEIVTSLVSICAALIAVRMERRRPVEDDIRDAISAQTTLSPASGVLVIVVLLMAMESLLGMVFGALVDFVFAAIELHPSSAQLQEFILPPVSLFTSVSGFLLLIPVSAVVSHRLPRHRTPLWLLLAVILSRVLRTAIVLVVLDRGIYSLNSIVVSYLLLPIPFLWLSAFIGYLLSRRRHDQYLLRRAFTRLNKDDKRAALELLMQRKSVG